MYNTNFILGFGSGGGEGSYRQLVSAYNADEFHIPPDFWTFLHATGHVPQWGLPTKQVSRLTVIVGPSPCIRVTNRAALFTCKSLIHVSGLVDVSTCRHVAPSSWNIKSWRFRNTMTKFLLGTFPAPWPLSQGVCVCVRACVCVSVTVCVCVCVVECILCLLTFGRCT